jgi:hypothetical protein
MSTVRILDAIVFAWNLMKRNTDLVISILVFEMIVFYGGYYMINRLIPLDSSAEIIVSHLVFLGIALIVLIAIEVYVHLMKYQLVKLSYKSMDTYSFAEIRRVSWTNYKRFASCIVLLIIAIVLLGLVVLAFSGGLTMNFLLVFTLLLIPGIIISYMYILAPYIAVEHPTGKYKDVFAYSKKLTTGVIPSLFLFFAVFGIFRAGLEALPMVGGVSVSIFHLSFGAYTFLFVFFDLIQQDKY